MATNWITREGGEDQAENDGRPVRNADTFAALQHEQQADSHDGGHAHRGHAHCSHHPRYERPRFGFFLFFFCGTIRTLQFVSFVGLLIHFSLFDSQIGLKYDNVIQNVEMEIAPMASNNKYCFKGKKKAGMILSTSKTTW